MAELVPAISTRMARASLIEAAGSIRAFTPVFEGYARR